MKNTQQEIKLKNQRGCFLRLSLALSLFHLILYAFCGDVYTKFIVFAYDISTSKAFRILATWKDYGFSNLDDTLSLSIW